MTQAQFLITRYLSFHSGGNCRSPLEESLAIRGRQLAKIEKARATRRTWESLQGSGALKRRREE
ncbi:MAG: hypothetical protein VW339_04025 [Quisquiliibacterium sp.]